MLYHVRRADRRHAEHYASSIRASAAGIIPCTGRETSIGQSITTPNDFTPLCTDFLKAAEANTFIADIALSTGRIK